MDLREKGRDLALSYDKSPYTHRKIQKATWQYKERYPKVRLHNDCEGRLSWVKEIRTPVLHFLIEKQSVGGGGQSIHKT